MRLGVGFCISIGIKKRFKRLFNQYDPACSMIKAEYAPLAAWRYLEHKLEALLSKLNQGL